MSRDKKKPKADRHLRKWVRLFNAKDDDVKQAILIEIDRRDRSPQLRNAVQQQRVKEENEWKRKRAD